MFKNDGSVSVICFFIHLYIFESGFDIPGQKTKVSWWENYPFILLQSGLLSKFVPSFFSQFRISKDNILFTPNLFIISTTLTKT